MLLTQAKFKHYFCTVIDWVVQYKESLTDILYWGSKYVQYSDSLTRISYWVVKSHVQTKVINLQLF